MNWSPLTDEETLLLLLPSEPRGAALELLGEKGRSLFELPLRSRC